MQYVALRRSGPVPQKGHIAHVGDSLQGVDKFLADMHQGDRGVESGVTDWSRVHGSGKVVFTRARFRNAGDDVASQVIFSEV